jgi:hypothetical protein
MSAKTAKITARIIKNVMKPQSPSMAVITLKIT